MNTARLGATLALSLLALVPLLATAAPDPRDTSLVQRMTLQEKINQLMLLS